MPKQTDNKIDLLPFEIHAIATEIVERKLSILMEELTNELIERFGLIETEVIKKQPKGDKGDKHTDEEIVALVKPLIPPPAKNGIDGRNPLHVGKVPPINPQIGDLWYQP